MKSVVFVLALWPLFALEVEKIIVTPTFESIGIVISEAPNDPPPAVRYRPSNSADGWRPAPPLIPIRGQRLATSIFFLQEDTSYDISIDGLNEPIRATTRSSRIPGSVHDIYVDPTDERAFPTIESALAAAQPGTTVHVKPGTYREQVRPPISGRSDAWIRIVADAPGVLLDGGETISSSWQDEGDGIYSTPYTRKPRYASLDGVRLYRHSSLNNLRNNGDGITGGFFAGGTRLYVLAPDRAALEGRTVRAAVRPYGFYLERRSYIEISGFELGWYDSQGVVVRDSDHIVVRNMHVHDAPEMVLVRGGRSTGNLIENNVIWGSGVPDWPWEICHHDHDCSSNGVNLRESGRGNVVRRNRISGLYNGIYLGGWVPDYPEDWAMENDVYENVISLIKDDAIEPECQAINLRIFRNRIYDSFVGISLAPIETGPTWVLYNEFSRPRGHDKGRGQWLKIAVNPKGEKPEGQVRIYHNSAHVTQPGQNGWSSAGSANTHLVNNVVFCTRYVFENTTPDQYPSGNWWDYNNLYTTDAANYIKWENRRMSAAAFRETVGFQRNGLEQRPAFLDPANGDLSLNADDPGIDRALYLPGINDGFEGVAPDMGAREFRPATK